MKRLIVLIAAAGMSFSSDPEARAEDTFSPLFNGRDLSGWKVIGENQGAWKAEGEMLVCEGGDGWLRSREQFADFILRLEWKLPPAGNSGVFLRAPAEGNGAYAGIEIQILDHWHEQYKDIRPVQFTGSVYDVVAAKREGLLPAGEWNAYEIAYRGSRIKVVLNGITIVEADLSEHNDRLQQHPGLARTRGFIGLQAHGSRVEFRNIRIRRLD